MTESGNGNDKNGSNGKSVPLPLCPLVGGNHEKKHCWEHLNLNGGHSHPSHGMLSKEPHSSILVNTDSSNASGNSNGNGNGNGFTQAKSTNIPVFVIVNQTNANLGANANANSSASANANINANISANINAIASVSEFFKKKKAKCWPRVMTRRPVQIPMVATIATVLMQVLVSV
ncbi:methylmalonyl-CoA mutase, large subunit, partial [Reticulomyxa filosa]